jgi:Ca2+/H+ antiporter
VGLKYWKYTIDGTNIFFINLMAVVMFVILDYWVLREMLELNMFITQPAFLFVGALLSIMPLAYFIGQAVASISAQSSMGLGAAINAFFSTLVEVYLYCVALNQGKGQLVEGSIIGSIFAGILFLPGLSMCFGAIKRKTQRFNAKSAGVTSTMLLFAVIAAFGPTLFYQIYGTVSPTQIRNKESANRTSSTSFLACHALTLRVLGQAATAVAATSLKHPPSMTDSTLKRCALIVGLLPHSYFYHISSGCGLLSGHMPPSSGTMRSTRRKSTLRTQATFYLFSSPPTGLYAVTNNVNHQTLAQRLPAALRSVILNYTRNLWASH